MLPLRGKRIIPYAPSIFRPLPGEEEEEEEEEEDGYETHWFNGFELVYAVIDESDDESDEEMEGFIADFSDEERDEGRLPQVIIDPVSWV
ncbi:hypothetical protein NW759_015917 [Fusarium solani]|nr:hypothetical protein NW759_015917 [Fusarium solani]